MYRRNPDWGWDSVAAAGATTLVVVIAIVVAAVIATIFIALVRELVRIFLKRAIHPTRLSPILWGALITAFALWFVAAVLTTISSLALTGLILAAWTFLGLIIVAEVVDVLAGQDDQEALKDAGNLESYLTEPFAPSPTPNGKTATPAGVR